MDRSAGILLGECKGMFVGLVCIGVNLSSDAHGMNLASILVSNFPNVGVGREAILNELTKTIVLLRWPYETSGLLLPWTIGASWSWTTPEEIE